MLLYLILFFLFLSWSPVAPSVTDVHIVFSNHLDVGYNGIPEVGFIANVVNTYFDLYFPRAINTSAYFAKNLPQYGGYSWMTHSWLVSMYVDCPPGLGFHCPNQTSLQNFVAAVKRGWIYWHAAPFNLQPEFAEPSLFEFGVQMTHALDDLFGRNRSAVLSQRDVPGMTRAVVPLLVRNGVTGVTVGVNGGSAPPAVPSAFVWRDHPSGTQLLALQHGSGYGGIMRDDCVVLPFLADALAYAIKSDNQGPHTVDEAVAVYEQLAAEFPGARLFASTYDQFFGRLSAVQSLLPVVTGEIGDTWIYGIPADPRKTAAYREVARARAECLAAGRCSSDEYVLQNSSRFLIKVPEHTDGLPSTGNSEAWSNELFEQVRNSTPFANCTQSWLEQRQYVQHSIDALPREHPLRIDIERRLQSLQPAVPSTAAYVPLANASQPFTTCGPALSVLQFDAATGGIVGLSALRSAVPVAAADRPLAEFSYQTFSESDMWDFWNAYFQVYSEAEAFVKENASLAHPVAATYSASLQTLYQHVNGSCDFLLHLTMPQVAVEQYGGAQELWEHVRVHADDADLLRVEIHLQWFNKTATRLPETSWLTFNPVTTAGGVWTMDKLGTPVSPLEVLLNGSQHQHVVWGGVEYSDERVSVLIDPRDAPMVSPDLPPRIFPAPGMAPLSEVGAMSFSLHNNVWNTNYALWSPYAEGDENSKFRFELVIQPAHR